MGAAFTNVFMLMLFPLVALVAPPAVAAPAAAADAVTGYWVTDGGLSHVQIYRGPDGKYYGRIAWLKEPEFPSDFADKTLAGKPRTDYKNPDKSLRGRALIGLAVLQDFAYQPQHDNWKGTYCYNPKEGKSSRNCLLWLSDNGMKLHVRGYLGIFWETHTWDRYTSSSSASAPAASTNQ